MKCGEPTAVPGGWRGAMGPPRTGEARAPADEWSFFMKNGCSRGWITVGDR